MFVRFERRPLSVACLAIAAAAPAESPAQEFVSANRSAHRPVGRSTVYYQPAEPAPASATGEVTVESRELIAHDAPVAELAAECISGALSCRIVGALGDDWRRHWETSLVRRDDPLASPAAISAAPDLLPAPTAEFFSYGRDFRAIDLADLDTSNAAPLRLRDYTSWQVGASARPAGAATR